MTLNFKSVELHLSPSAEFTSRGFGKRVVAAGGKFNECRGNSYKRFVHLPATEVSLITELLKSFPCVPRDQAGTVVLGREVHGCVYEAAHGYSKDHQNLTEEKVSNLLQKMSESVQKKVDEAVARKEQSAAVDAKRAAEQDWCIARLREIASTPEGLNRVLDLMDRFAAERIVKAIEGEELV